MGIRNSYKAFFGLELSLGKLWSTKASFSVDRRIEPTEHVREPRNYDGYNERTVANTESISSHIKDAVYSMADETSGQNSKSEMLLEKHNRMQQGQTKIQSMPKHIRTYLQIEAELNYSKGKHLNVLV